MIAFSPVRQDPEVLALFLEAMAWQNIELWTYDDNTDSESSRLLADTKTLPAIDLPDGEYQRASTHVWSPGSMRRVAAIKNHAIDLFLETDHEHLFLIDSDVLIPPGAIEHLREADERVIAATYWTEWHVGSRSGDGPNMFWLDPPTTADLRRPGHWSVQGLGACTLIRRDVFASARFEETRRLVNEGEDRWFCWRCHQAGIPLFACTHLDVFHFYRDSQSDDARRWVEDHRAAQLV